MENETNKALNEARAEVMRLKLEAAMIPRSNEVKRHHNMRARIEAEAIVDRLSDDPNASLRARVAELEAMTDARTINIKINRDSDTAMHEWLRDATTGAPAATKEYQDIRAELAANTISNDMIANLKTQAPVDTGKDRGDFVAPVEYLSPDRGTMVRVQDGFATWMTNDADGKTKVETVEPATVARDALKQAIHDGFKNGLNVDDLVAKATGYYGAATSEYQKIRADLKAKVASDIPMMTPAEVDAYHHRDEPNAATIQDLFDTIKKQAATIAKQAKWLQAKPIVALMGKDADDHMIVENDRLKTEIATRDRLLDDQCQTIGKLERERDLALHGRKATEAFIASNNRGAK